jgi:hypothetical protein
LSKTLPFLLEGQALINHILNPSKNLPKTYKYLGKSEPKRGEKRRKEGRKILIRKLSIKVQESNTKIY